MCSFSKKPQANNKENFLINSTRISFDNQTDIVLKHCFWLGQTLWLSLKLADEYFNIFFSYDSSVTRRHPFGHVLDLFFKNVDFIKIMCSRVTKLFKPITNYSITFPKVGNCYNSTCSSIVFFLKKSNEVMTPLKK